MLARGATVVPPVVGDSHVASPRVEGPSGNDWMFLSAIGGGFLLITLVLLLGGPRRERPSERDEDD